MSEETTNVSQQPQSNESLHHESRSLIERAKNIITMPKMEWEVVATESPDIGKIATGYVIPLALIAAVASFIVLGLILAPIFIGIFGISVLGGGLL